jgi:hypothetical protein
VGWVFRDNIPKAEPARPDRRTEPRWAVLQRSAGNRAVALAVQRGWLPGAVRFDKGTPEEIAAAIQSKDPADVKAIESFEKADLKQRLDLIDVLLKQDTIGVFDRNAMDRIWAHVEIGTVEGPALDRFRTCAERGWKPKTYGYLTLVGDFRDSMKQNAITNLNTNIDLLQKEATRLGAGDPGKVAPDADKDAAIREQQDLALLIKDAKRLMAKAGDITVGFAPKNPGDVFALDGKPVKFQPDHQPVRPTEVPVTEANPAARQMPWDGVYKQYADLAETVTGVLAHNPALYVLSTLTEEAPDDPSGRLNFGQTRITGFETMSAVEARKKVATAMLETYNNARISLGKVLGGQVDPLQFDALISRHTSGQFGPKYATPFAKWAIPYAVEDAASSFDKTMEHLGLVLLLASVALGTAGAGTPLLGAVLAAANIGTAAAGAAMKTFEAQNLTQLSESSASPRTETVTQERAAKAKLDAIVYQFSLLVAIGGEAVGAVFSGGLGNVRALPPAEQGKAVIEALESMEVSQVAIRTGLSPEELQTIVKRADPSASVLKKIDRFLFGGPITATTSGNNLQSMMRQMKYTFRELMNELWGIQFAAEDRLFLAVNRNEAELIYVKLIEDTPGREAAMYINTATGEHALVQGHGDWRIGGVRQRRALGGYQPGTWTLLEHYHPERNFAVQFPSGVGGDFEALLREHGERNLADVMAGRASSTAITTRVSARIRYRDPVSGTYHFTTYGYDPGSQVGHFFVTVETKGGGQVDYSFRNMNELLATVRRQRPGQPVIR